MFKGIKEFEKEIVGNMTEKTIEFGLKRIDDCINIVENSLTIREAIIKLKLFEDGVLKLSKKQKGE